MDAGKGRLIKSVADVHFFNKNDELIAIGDALSTSAITSEIQETIVNGGYLNPELFNFKYGRTLSLTATSVTFKPEYLEMVLGESFTNKATGRFAFNECATVESSKIKIANKVKQGRKVLVQKGDKAEYAIVDSDGVSVTVPGEIGIVDGDQVTVAYWYGEDKDTASTLVISSNAQPMTVKAVLTMHYQEQDGTEGLYQIVIPKLQMDGNVTLDLSADGTSTMDLSGKALAVKGACGKDVYATWTNIPLKSEKETIADVILAPKSMNITTSEGTALVKAYVVYNSGRKEQIDLSAELPSGVTITAAAGAVINYAKGTVTAAKNGDTTLDAKLNGALVDTIAIHVSGQSA